MANRFKELSERYRDLAEDFAELLNETDYADLEEYFGDEVNEFIVFYDELVHFSKFLRDGEY